MRVALWSRGAYRVLVRKPEVKRPHGRTKHRGDDINIDVKEIAQETCTGLLWLRIGKSGGLL